MTSPPVAKRVPHSFTLHGVTIEDPYAWLRDPGYPDVKDADVLVDTSVCPAGSNIIVGTPGRVFDHINRGNLKLEGCDHAVLDEAAPRGIDTEEDLRLANDRWTTLMSGRA